MILKTVMERIEAIPDISFNHYFVRYVMQIQDQIIDNETPKGNITQLSELIESTYKELIFE